MEQDQSLKLIQEVHIRRNTWFEYILKQDNSLSLPSGFVCNDNEIALLLQLPRPVRDYLRRQRAMIVISPIPNMKDSWTYSIESIQTEVFKKTSSMIKTYESLLGYIKGNQLDMSDDIGLTNLRRTATDIFDALPDGIRQELEQTGRAPVTVFSAIESSSA